MQNIHVRRYKQQPTAGYLGWIEPEDRSWLVFIDVDGVPLLMRLVTKKDENGAEVSEYEPDKPLAAIAQ